MGAMFKVVGISDPQLTALPGLSEEASGST